MTAELVTDALVMAIWRRGKPDALIHHSDRGSQYTSDQFQRLMADHGVTCSMSRSGKEQQRMVLRVEPCSRSLLKVRWNTLNRGLCYQLVLIVKQQRT